MANLPSTHSPQFQQLAAFDGARRCELQSIRTPTSIREQPAEVVAHSAPWGDVSTPLPSLPFAERRSASTYGAPPEDPGAGDAGTSRGFVGISCAPQFLEIGGYGRRLSTHSDASTPSSTLTPCWEAVPTRLSGSLRCCPMNETVGSQFQADFAWASAGSEPDSDEEMVDESDCFRDFWTEKLSQVSGWKRGSLAADVEESYRRERALESNNKRRCS
eukprot:jgi/Tetstr1/455851/TSEL_042641.t1